MKYNTKEELEQRELEIRKRSNNLSSLIGAYYEFYKLLQQVISIIPEKRGENELKENPARYLLHMWTTLKIIHNSNSIMLLISRGYYHEGLILLRSIQEEYHHLLFFTFHPNNDIKQYKEKWIKYRHINKFMRTSKFIPKRWLPKQNLTDTLYSILSSYVHPSWERWDTIIKVQKDPLEFDLKILPHYELDAFNAIFTGVLAFQAITLDLLTEIYQIEIIGAGLLEQIDDMQEKYELKYLK